MLSWAHVVSAEIALRRGRVDQAEALFLQALRGEPDLYNVIAYADLLIESRRFAEALALLANQPRADAVLLRTAIAAEKTDPAEAQRLTGIIQRRIAMQKMRGDLSHAREEALFELKLAGDPAAALDAALRNWQLQRESIDARLLLESALLAGQPESALPVLQWMEQNNSDDVRLLKLRERVQALQT